MKKLYASVTAIVTLLFLTLSLSLPTSASAADIRTGEHVSLADTEKNLKNLYVFGSDIEVDAPVADDLVTAGGDTILNGAIEKDLITAGGTILVKGKVGDNARIAGGTITIDAPITGDLVVAGGTITLTKNASIGGDLISAGGKISVQGPVRGNVLMQGGDVTLNSTIGGSVNAGEVRTLTLGPKATVHGNLSYHSEQPAQISSSHAVAGQIHFHKTENKQQKERGAQFLTTAAVYKLIVDIILSLLFVYFFKNGIIQVLQRMQAAPWKSAGVGFSYALFTPLVSFLLFILFWLGLASLLFYFLLFIISIFIVKLFLGWIVLEWWHHRQKEKYELDWQAAIVGPVLLFVLLLIPLLGWLAAAILFFVAVGALLGTLLDMMPHRKVATKKK